MLASLRNAARRTAIGSRNMSMSPIPVTIPHTGQLINGRWEEGSSTFEVADPRTEEHICNFAEANVDDMDRAVGAARKAFDEGPWPRMTGYERSRILHKLADLIEANTDLLGSLETLDNGKP